MTVPSTSSRRKDPTVVADAPHQDTAALFRAGRRQKALEFGLLLLAIAAAAGVIWGIVRLALPRGTALSEVRSSAVTQQPVLPSVPTPELIDFDGTIAKIRRSVQMRASSELAWSSAVVGRAIHNEDAIHTLAGANAVVTVKGQGDISIGENSLVIFQTNSEDAFLGTQTAVASVTSGTLTGHLKARDGAEVLGIRLPHATVRLRGVKPGQAADFNLQVNRDQSASIVILRGKAQVRARSGVSTLNSGDGIQISADGSRAEVQSIPPVPSMIEPAADQVIVYQKVHPKVQFCWQSSASVDEYHFVLARDRDFRDTIEDQHVSHNVSGSTCTKADLRTGDYYWRITSRRGWLESSPSDIAALHVERDIDAKVRDVLTELRQKSDDTSKLIKLVDQAKGVLVFPRVVKAGFLFGGEYGEGALMSAGHTVDYYTLKSASFGLQIGGQTQKVVVLFMTDEAYERFLKSNGWKVDVDSTVTLAAVSTDRAVDPGSTKGSIKSFIFSDKGLMYNMSLKGSKISKLPD